MSHETAVLIVNERLQVLTRREGDTVSIPKVTVDVGRAGIALSRAVREQLRMEVFCLVMPSSAVGALPMLRPQAEHSPAPNGYVWVDPVSEPQGFGQILEAFSSIDVTDKSFGRFAWYTDVQDWLGARLTQQSHTVRSLEQWNGRIGGVLLRVVTDGPQFWLKAVSDFNVREFGIAQLLAAKHPGRFPKIVAAKPSWRTLLLDHVEGTELYDCNDIATWKLVAEQLAELQMDWVGTSEELLPAGAADLRAEAMLRELPSFLDHLEDAMGRQEKTPPDVLTRAELDEFTGVIEDLCIEVADLPFADSLANADFSPHNTLITDNGPVFIDWAEACVSLPLIAGEYLWNRMVVETPERHAWRDELREVYLARWMGGYGSEPVVQARELLPAFSVLAVAMFYHQREGRGPSHHDAYLRSLARKLKSELNKLSLNSGVVRR